MKHVECKPLALLLVKEWNGDSFVLLTAVWIMTSLSKDQRSKEAQVSSRLNGSAFVDEFNYAFINSHNSWAEDRTVLTRFHCSCVKIQRQELVKFVRLTFVTIASSIQCEKPFNESNDINARVIHTKITNHRFDSWINWCDFKIQIRFLKSYSLSGHIFTSKLRWWVTIAK